MRAGEATVLAGELDGAVGPGSREPGGVRTEADEEVALGVGDGLDGHARDIHPQRHARQFGGDEVPQRTAYRGGDPLALDRLRGRWVVEDPATHDHLLGAAVPEVRLDPEMGRRS